MDYTLFVDESGHFGYGDNRREDWIVGGVLCPMARKDAEKQIGNRLNPVPSQYGLGGRGDMHRTELNRKAQSHDSDWTFGRISDLTGTLFKTVQSVAKDTQFLAVHNPQQQGVQDPEDTYRMMLLDLIGLADAALPTDQTLDSLQLCIATRTSREQGRMSTRHDLEAVLERIQDAVEVDLASRGLLGVLDDDLYLQQQTRSWMLTVADFWCNTVYNMHHEHPKALVDDLVASNRARIFTTSTSTDRRIRRAHVAERDGSYGLALYRWAALDLTGGARTLQNRAMERLCQHVTAAARSPRPAFETVIEMLWQEFGESERYDPFIGSLKRVQQAVQQVAGEPPSAQLEAILFRIRSMIHLAKNRDGQTDQAREVGMVQKEAERQLVQDPANFALVLDSQLNRIHTLQHTLDHQAAFEVAKTHRDRVQMYGELWDLYEDQDSASFTSSRMYLKATMTWIITGVHAAPVDGVLDEVLTAVENLKATELAGYDRSRLLNYSILARLKREWFEGALEESMQALDESEGANVYAGAHAARAAATALLADPTQHREAVQAIYDTIQGWMPDEPTGTFWGLMARDLALVELLLNGDKRAARTVLKTGRAALTWDRGDTMIRQWIDWTFDLAGRFIGKRSKLHVDVPDAFREVLGANTVDGRLGLMHVRRMSLY